MTITDEIDYKSEQDEINTDHEDTKPLNKSQSRLSKSPAGRKPSLAGIKPTLGKVVDDEMVADPMELRGPFTCQMFKCKQTLDDAQSVLRYCEALLDYYSKIILRIPFSFSVISINNAFRRVNKLFISYLY